MYRAIRQLFVRPAPVVPPAPEQQHVRILALTGGGIMSRFTARAMEEIEAAFLRSDASAPPAPLAANFDVMAGTSAGGLCVAGLLLGRSPAEIGRLFDIHGPRIFPPRSMARDLRRFVRSKYDPEPLHAAVDAALRGENPLLGDFRQIVAFPAIDESAGRSVVLTNADPAFQHVPLRDAVLASTAAPTYFPPHRIASLGRRYLDGGLFANAPDLAAISIARQRWPRATMADILLLSIGTGSFSLASALAEDHPGQAGFSSWGRVLKLAMHSQVEHTEQVLACLDLGANVRIDPVIAGAGATSLDLDNASVQAMRLMVEAGSQALSGLSEADWLALAALFCDDGLSPMQPIKDTQLGAAGGKEQG